MNVPSRFRIWFSVLIMSVVSVPAASVAALYIIAWFRASSPVEWEFARSTIETYEPAAFGLLFLFIGVVPVVITLLYHGKRTFVEKYKAQWREHENLKHKVGEFRLMFPDGDVTCVMEDLRDKRLNALADLRDAVCGKPEEMKAEDARNYRIALDEASAKVTRLEVEIENARNLLSDTFGIPMPPTWYFLCPKPDYSHDMRR